ncbi:TerD family protein [Methylomicrobium lacus]|uniref:TerD family protein n=1 Tax=Methylomicrobium lacus TaxID=136992 RepID=UPI00045E85BB|nr:TerD family protein [Methylomicrobium lacus]
MSLKLERGANFSLTKLVPNPTHFFVGLDWPTKPQSNEAFDIDGSCFLLSEQNRVRNNTDFIFYNQRQDSVQSVWLLEDVEQVQFSKGKTGFGVDLARIPAEISHVVFCLTIHNAEEKQQSFSMLDWLSLNLVEQETLTEIAAFRCEQELSKETAILCGELYRHNQEWKFKAIGQGFINGLGALAENFGVVLDNVAPNSEETPEDTNELVITKKKRRSPQEVIAEQMTLIQGKMKQLLPQIISSSTNGINESSTRLVLDRIFQDVLGYSIDEIKTEQKIQGRAADYVLAPDGRDTIVIEAKRAGTPLRQKQIFQATSYAAYSGIQWAILTNLTEWQFYKVSTVDKVDPHWVFTIDLNKGLDDENTYNLLLISKFGVVRKGLIEKVWLKRVCLKAETLIAAILNDEVISKIRLIIGKETGGQITNDEVKRAIEMDVLKI